MEEVYIDGDFILNGFGEVIGKVKNPKKPKKAAGLSVAKGATPQKKKPLMSTASVRAGKANAAGAKKATNLQTTNLRSATKRRASVAPSQTALPTGNARRGRPAGALSTANRATGNGRATASNRASSGGTGTRRRASTGDTAYMNARAEMFDTMDDFCLGQATQEQSVAKFKAALTARCNRNR